MQIIAMREPNAVNFELSFEQGRMLEVRREWIAEQKMDGIRAILEDGTLRLPQVNLDPPGSLPEGWRRHVLDGCLIGDTYYVFDVLKLDGLDIHMRPLLERRQLLHSLQLPPWCRFVPCGKNIGEFLEAVLRDGGSGIVLKNLLEPYGKGEWIKVESPAHKADHLDREGTVGAMP